MNGAAKADAREKPFFQIGPPFKAGVNLVCRVRIAADDKADMRTRRTGKSEETRRPERRFKADADALFLVRADIAPTLRINPETQFFEDGLASRFIGEGRRRQIQRQ